MGYIFPFIIHYFYTPIICPNLLPEEMSNPGSIITADLEPGFSDLVETLLATLEIGEPALIASIVSFECRMPIEVLPVSVNPPRRGLRHRLSVIEMLEIIESQHVEHGQENPFQALLQHICLSLKLHHSSICSTICRVKIKQPLFPAVPSCEITCKVGPSHDLLAESLTVTDIGSSLNEFGDTSEAATKQARGHRWNEPYIIDRTSSNIVRRRKGRW
jgi:hypothetical protein